MASTASSSSSDPAPNPNPNKPASSSSFIRPSQSHPPLFLSSSSAAAVRGFPTRPATSDRVVTVANPTAVMTLTQSQAQAQSRPYVFVDGAHAMRPPAQHQNQQQQQQFVVPRQLVVASGAGGGAHKNGAATAHPKVATFPISSASENKNSNDRDKNREDTVMVTHDRKVRLSEGSSGSLYSLCRSWVRNGLPQDIQPTVGDGLKLLPKPLPASMVNSRIVKQSADANGGEVSDKEDGDSVEKLSAQDLLKRHIKRAKNVRARLRKERLLRIERYKHRLSLLLPIQTDVIGRNEATPGS